MSNPNNDDEVDKDPHIHLYYTMLEMWCDLVRDTTFLHKKTGDDWYCLTDEEIDSSDSDEADESDDEDDYVRRRIYLIKRTKNIDVAVSKVNEIGLITERLRRQIGESKWLHWYTTHFYKQKDLYAMVQPCDIILTDVNSVFAYCRNWAFTDGVYNSNINGGAVELTSEAAEAFRILYDECVALVQLILAYVQSEDFVRDFVIKRNSPSAFLSVIEHIPNILTNIDDFDPIFASDLLEFGVKMCLDHLDLIKESKWRTVRPMLKGLFDRLSKMEFPGGIISERAVKMAVFYLKMLLRLCKLFPNELSTDLFEAYANSFVSIKKMMNPEENPNDKILLDLFQEMLPIMYARGASFAPCYTNDLELYLELSINILTLLTIETDRQIVQVYAKQAFMLYELANILHNIALRNECNDSAHYRTVVVRLCALIVSMAQRYPDLMQTIDEALGRCSNDYFGSLLCYDVWQLRSAFMTPEQRVHTMIMAWSSCERMSVFGYRTAIVFKRALLCSFYDTLPIEFQREFVTEFSKLESECDSAYFYAENDIPLEQLQLWSVLHTSRIADPETRSVLEQRITRGHVAADAPLDTPAGITSDDWYYLLERTRFASYGIHNEQTATLIESVCKHLHPELPVIFAAELDYVLDMINHLPDALILCTLETLDEHFAKRAREWFVDQHPDDLIRLLSIDLLCRLSANKSFDAGEKCVNIIAKLFSRMLRDADVIVQMNCWRRFVDTGAAINCRGIVLNVLENCEGIKINVGRVLNKEQLPALDDMQGVQLVPVKYTHVCKGRFKNLSENKMKLTFERLEQCITQIERLRQYKLLGGSGEEMTKLKKRFDYSLGDRRWYDVDDW